MENDQVAQRIRLMITEAIFKTENAIKDLQCACRLFARVMPTTLVSDMARINLPMAICRVHTCSQGLIFRVDADSKPASEEAVKLLEKHLKRYTKKPKLQLKWTKAYA